jgi:HYDIN/CFA65/VesB-like, Ig-like domain/Abnormal spindle-like microcephaly-assoc'd, ASPM-SPD-2-Hydin
MTKRHPARLSALVVVLALATMVGCQGLSRSSSTTNPPNNPTAGQLTVAPTSISFGVVKVGNNQSQPATLTNSGGSSLQVTKVTVTGTGFSVSGLSFPVTLASGQSQGFTVIFTPQSAGSVSGNLAIANTGSSPTVNVALSGGPPTAGAVTLNPTSLNFGSVPVGSSQGLPETLINSGGSTVTITQVNPTGTGFSVSGLNLPLVLAAGQSQAFTVTFTPTSAGSSSGNLAIISDASNSPTSEPLTGTGTTPTQHSVDLSWTASTSQNVIGYNIYRGVTSGGPYTKINSVLNASTLYSDTTVADGQTYYYVTTAANSSNEESSYSNQTTAVIPPP